MKINLENIVSAIGTLKTEKEYKKALILVEELMDAAAGSKEEFLLNIISLMIEKYEEKHYPIPNPDPLSAIRFRLEQMGKETKDLAQILGGKNRVSEILSGKRNLTVKMMQNLHKHLGVPAEALLHS